MTKEELKAALDAHAKWLAGEGGARAYLRGADLTGANLTGAYLTGAYLPAYQLVPEEGAFIAWKKVASDQGSAILKLQILAKAKRVSSLVGRKCRAEAAKVLAVYPKNATGLRSKHDASFNYTVGEAVRVKNFNDDIRVECAPGIHFFITRKEAEDY